MRIGRIGVMAAAAMLGVFGSVGSASAVPVIQINAVQDETAAAPVSPFTLMNIGTGTANSYAGNQVGVGNTYSGWTLTSATNGSGIFAGNSSSAASVFGQGNATTQYLTAVGGGGAITMTTGQSQDSLQILWGTVDTDVNRNLLVTTNVGTDSISGADIFTAMQSFCGATCTPVAGQFEAYVTITGLSPFTSVTFSDTSTNSFEFLLAAVPEPSTWAMMILGFLGVGFLAYRKQGTLRIV